jgi:hypothetical protein
MSVTIVQDVATSLSSTTATGANTPVSVTLASTTAGNVLVALVESEEYTNDTFTMSGGGVASWTQAVYFYDSTNATQRAVYYGTTAGGATTVTVTSAKGTANGYPIYLEVLEVSGIQAAVDATATSAAGAGGSSPETIASGTVTTTHAADFLVAMGSVYADSSSATLGTVTTGSPSAGWTALSGDNPSATWGTSAMVAAYQVVSATGNYGASWSASWANTSNRGDVDGVVVAFPQSATPSSMAASEYAAPAVVMRQPVWTTTVFM